MAMLTSCDFSFLVPHSIALFETLCLTQASNESSITPVGLIDSAKSV